MADLFDRDPEPWRVVLGPADLPKFRAKKESPLAPGLPTKNHYRGVNPKTKRIYTRGGIRKALVKAMAAATWEDTGKPLPVFRCPVVLHLLQYAPKQYGKVSPVEMRGLDASQLVDRWHARDDAMRERQPVAPGHERAASRARL